MFSQIGRMNLLGRLMTCREFHHHIRKLELAQVQKIAHYIKMPTSGKNLHTKVTPDFHLTYNKNGGNLGLALSDNM